MTCYRHPPENLLYLTVIPLMTSLLKMKVENRSTIFPMLLTTYLNECFNQVIFRTTYWKPIKLLKCPLHEDWPACLSLTTCGWSSILFKDSFKTEEMAVLSVWIWMEFATTHMTLSCNNKKNGRRIYWIRMKYKWKFNTGKLSLKNAN